MGHLSLRRAALAGLGFVAASGGALARDLVAIRPGLMCQSAAALAELTLHGGGSKTARPGATAADVRTKEAGGCIDIPPGARVAALSERRQTAIVLYDPGDGGGMRRFIVPLIDFTPAEAAAPPPAAPSGAPTPLLPPPVPPAPVTQVPVAPAPVTPAPAAPVPVAPAPTPLLPTPLLPQPAPAASAPTAPAPAAATPARTGALEGCIAEDPGAGAGMVCRLPVPTNVPTEGQAVPPLVNCAAGPVRLFADGAFRGCLLAGDASFRAPDAATRESICQAGHALEVTPNGAKPADTATCH